MRNVARVDRPVDQEGIFVPSPAAAAAADLRIRQELDASVGAIVDALSVAAGRVVAGVKCPAAPGPLVYGAYADLREAVLADDLAGALSRLDRYASSARSLAGPFVANWADFSADDRALMSRLLNSDLSTRIELRPPCRDAASAATEAVVDAVALLDAAAPELAGEIRALIRQIVLVAGSVNEDGAFAGGSCFDLWGALFLNAERHLTRVAAVNGLSHESAHAVLFGHSGGRPFVENPDVERHASPLRDDPRPLDGIFHATFVSARMCYAQRSVLASGLLDRDEAASMEQYLGDSRAAFDDGRATLLRHACMTAGGQALLDGATRFMQAG